MGGVAGAPFSLRTAMLWGMEARPVTVEIDMTNGLPGITVVGRPDASVEESRTRVRCAIRAAGFTVPRKNIVVNLSPAELRKSGTAFDLPIAVAILAATGQIPARGLEACLIVGELSLEGSVRPVRGLLAYAELAERLGLTLVAPGDGAGGVPGTVDMRPVASLAQFGGAVEDFERGMPAPEVLQSEADTCDFVMVAGQEAAKRALAIATAGRHGILMVGPPGVGKTMLARCVPGLLPPLDEREAHEVRLVYSVAGVEDRRVAAGLRPFRAPHHASSVAGLLGGGRPVRPGEITLAHKGVLFLDELAEFCGTTLQALRQPLEEHVVRVTRAEGSYEFPADFALVAASNPCPCGHLGDEGYPCRCSETAVRAYRAKLGGPVLDRIAMMVTLERPDLDQVMGGRSGVATADLRELVARGRAFAQRRLRAADPAARLGVGVRAVLERANAGNEARRCLEELAKRSALSVRSIAAVVAVARTIADIDEREQVGEGDVLEAMGYRVGGGAGGAV